MSATMEPYKSLGCFLQCRPDHGTGERAPKFRYPVKPGPDVPRPAPFDRIAWEARQARIAELRSRVRVSI
jgi:hypothetical protein